MLTTLIQTAGRILYRISNPEPSDRAPRVATIEHSSQYLIQKKNRLEARRAELRAKKARKNR